MNKQTIQIDLPSDVLLALNESEDDLKQRFLLFLAVQLYTQEKLTIGKAAQLAGLSRLQFETLLSDSNISISNLKLEDVLGDIEKLR